MQFPFTTEEFLNIFRLYNQNIFPLQILFYLLAIFVVFLILKKLKSTNKIIAAILSFFWLWMGIVYHIIYFSSINKAAYIFGVLFILQGIVFFIYGVAADKLGFKYDKNIYNYLGMLFILYALIIYPLLGYILGHQYPYSPTFGLPCPTTIFTFGILLFIDKRISFIVLIIPFLWSIIGFGAALNLSIYEDFGLIITGLVSVSALLVHNKKISNYVAKTA
jgi:Family of unknown function (DUF6064)